MKSSATQMVTDAGLIGTCVGELWSIRAFVRAVRMLNERWETVMNIAFIQFNGMTALDLIGFYDTVMRLPRFSTVNISADLCAVNEEINDDYGLTIKTQKILPNLAEYDMVFVPGGFGTRKLRQDSAFISWLQTACTVEYKISVCTGSLLLGAAGFLTGKRATTHPNSYDLLAPYCEKVVESRIVPDGNVITGGGVSTSIDLGLYVVELLTDSNTAQKVQQSMDYPYYRPGMLGLDHFGN